MTNILKRSGMDWSVQVVPLSIKHQGTKKVSSYCNIIRTDKGFVLGNCLEGHKVKQNREVYEEIQRVINQHKLDLKITNVESLDLHGKHIRFELSNPEYLCVLDCIKHTISAVLHHDTGTVDLYHTFSFADSDSTLNIKTLPANTIEERILNTLSSDTTLESLSHFDELPVKSADSITTFLLNPTNSEMSDRKKASKILLENCIKTSMQMHGNTCSAVLKGVFTYSSSIRTKDIKTSTFVGKAAELNNRAFEYLKESHDF